MRDKLLEEYKSYVDKYVDFSTRPKLEVGNILLDWLHIEYMCNRIDCILFDELEMYICFRVGGDIKMMRKLGIIEFEND